MLEFAVNAAHPSAIRYPKTSVEKIQRGVAPIECGKAEVLSRGADGTIVCYGALLPNAVRAAERLRESGLEIGVVNARFLKPLDASLILRLVAGSPFLITLEESALQGGFGSAVLEACCDAGARTDHIRRLGIPDRFIEHAERAELLADLGLDVDGIVRLARDLAARFPAAEPDPDAVEGDPGAPSRFADVVSTPERVRWN
jgi:1-deoxy-D-xylulose-5-phosphate synthase